MRSAQLFVFAIMLTHYVLSPIVPESQAGIMVDQPTHG